MFDKLGHICVLLLLASALLLAQGRARPPERHTIELYGAPSELLVQTAVANYVASMPVLVFRFGLRQVIRVKIVEAYRGKAYNGYYTYQYDIVTDFITFDKSIKGYYTSFFFYQKQHKWFMFRGDFSLWGEPKIYHIPQEDRDMYNKPERDKSKEA